MYSFEDMYCQETVFVIGFLLVVANHKVIHGCHGPGTTMGSRRPGRSMTKLVFRQHIPNISEFTIGASGPAEGAIKRDDKRFKSLIQNYNPLVVFKDEEGTGADHMMSKRCKDRVNILAMMVSNEWPTVKLRVTEAWDEDGQHADGSLHYEGRAVDLTLDDFDKTKYGLLARMAVEAGFDWVFYESRHFIHASVIAEDSETAIYGSGCFPADGIVTTEDSGLQKMSELKVGDRVLTSDRTTGETKFSDVILMMHTDDSTIVKYLEISVTSHNRKIQNTIRLTATHLLFVHKHNIHASWRPQAIFASEVQIGDEIYINNGNNTQPSLATVTKINIRHHKGVYAPLTYDGTIIVDNVVASCYAIFDVESISHALFLPLRILWRWGVRWPQSLPGIHWYPKSIFYTASAFLPSGILKT